MYLWLCVAVVALLGRVESAGAGAARLVCYVEGKVLRDMGECTHLVYSGTLRGEKLDVLLKEYRKSNSRLKILLRVTDDDKDFRSIMKSKYIQGLEVFEAHKSLNRTKTVEYLESARSAISKSGGGPLFLALPSHPELLAKYYDLRALVKIADLMMVQTHALGLVNKMTYHPSRLSGLWDMMNTDSVVDLVVGLGIPASKVVISLPATARQFTLKNETLSTPGSPALDDEPKEIDQEALCKLLSEGRWTLERDQDLSGPYAFKNTTWVSFEDASSVDVKGKYARVRGLAGLALQNADKDAATSCGPSLKVTLAKVLNSQSRAPRAAVLRSLEQEILSSPVGHATALDALQLSPYRITQVVDSDGVIHSIREDTRTEFSCTRQGYFVHPRSCARFYRCVKFDQLSPEYTVFEFDCPAGLAFDSRYEVCVWPGSLPHSQACPGSSEIAPVPQTRFVCPAHEGYYADPENCRWFFACLDHGKAPLSAYEFRCPFGLGFDAEKLKCDWPWLVPACGNIARYEAEAHGFSAAILTGANGFHGQTADDVNIAAHQSLISGASLSNLVGIQSGFLSQDDALDGNFIASQELANSGLAHSTGYVSGGSAASYNSGHGNLEFGSGLVKATNYGDEEKYTSGSLILDEFRLPTSNKAGHSGQLNVVSHANAAVSHSQSQAGIQSTNLGLNAGYINVGHETANAYSGSSQSNLNQQYQGFSAAEYQDDNSGTYIHDPSGDYAEPYKHVDAPAVPYEQNDELYKHQTNEYKYDGSSSLYGSNGGKYVEENSGQYTHDDSGSYIGESNANVGYKVNYGGSHSRDYSGSYIHADSGKYVGSYGADYSGSYNHDDSGKYIAGIYRSGEEGLYKGFNTDSGSAKLTIQGNGNANSAANIQYQNSYLNANADGYLTGSKAYTGASHTLAAGAVNVGLVGKTTLVDGDYLGQTNSAFNQKALSSSTSHSINHGVSITHLGSDVHNYNDNGYSYVTTPTSSVVPTTVTPLAVTTAIPVIKYKTSYIQEQPKSSFKEIFGYSHPAITHVQPTVVAVTQHVTPKIQVTNYNEGLDQHLYSAGNTFNTGVSVTESNVKSASIGYGYPKPAVKFEEGITTHTTAAPIYIAKDFVHPTENIYKGHAFNQETVHETGYNHNYSPSIVAIEEPFKKVVAYTTGEPTVHAYAQPTHSPPTPHSYSHQTVHRVETAKVGSYSPNIAINENTGYEYSHPAVELHHQPQSGEYTTALPISVQPAVSYEPQVYAHQTVHKVETAYIDSIDNTKSSGYDYPKPAVKFDEAPKTYTEYTTPQPIISIKSEQPIVSTYRPHAYSHQTIHNVPVQKIVPVSSTPLPHIEVKYSEVSLYENPLLHHAPEITPAVSLVQPTETIYTQPKVQNYQTSIHQHEVQHVNTQQYQPHNTHLVPNVEINQESYSYPEIQSNVETYNAAKSHAQSFETSHQVYHQNAATYQNNERENKNVVFVSTTPSSLIYEDHYTEYVAPKKVETYKAPEYIPPKTDYVQTHIEVSTQPPNAYIEQQQSFIDNSNFNYDEHKALEHSESYETYKPVSPVQHISFSTTHEQPKKIENIDFGHHEIVSNTYKPISYDSPEIQFEYKAEEYLPPIVSTPKPVVITTFKQRTYLPPAAPTTLEYLPPSAETKYTAPEYLPPTVQPKYNAPEYLPPTVQPKYNVPEYLPPKTTARPIIKSTTQTPTYKYEEISTPVYKAPEYLPPLEDTNGPEITNYESFGLKNTFGNVESNPFQEYTVKKVESPKVVYSTELPLQRKHNIVIETSKSNLLGFGTVGPDAGLVSPVQYTTSTPIGYSTPQVTSTYAPIDQEIVQYTPSVPVRTKPKVAVVTKINDFNPLLVRKLGAVCSCQSPVLVLKGRRPNVQLKQDYDVDYDGSDYDDYNRGDISLNKIKAQSPINEYRSQAVTTSPVFASTINPIIVPDDAFYQDYQEPNNDYKIDVAPRGKEIYPETFVSSTPLTYSTPTEKIVKIRPRIKSVTVAPTYKTVLVKESVTPVTSVKDESHDAIESQSFDRYGPGGWRSRDETLQGSVDCQRAGLFRHPKQCNKFYACRWDCTKQRFTLHVFNCPVQLSFDPSLGACNWPSQGPACQGDTLLTNSV